MPHLPTDQRSTSNVQRPTSHVPRSTSHRPRNERGVALLLSLGILALLLILGMSFAFTARTERQAAGNSADLTRARLLAESGLERVMALMRHYCGSSVFPATATGHNFLGTGEDLFTKTNASSGLGSDGNWSGRSYAVSRLNSSQDAAGIASALATDLGFAFIPQRLDTEIDDTEELGSNISWQHIETPEPYTDSNSNGSFDIGEPYVDKNGSGSHDDYLIGRLAFLIVDESGKIDPGAVVTAEREPFEDENSNGSYDAGEFFHDVNRNGLYDSSFVSEGSEVRAGGHVQEVALDDAFRTMMSTGAKKWFSWKHMWEAGVFLNEAQAQTYSQIVFPFSYDKESYRDSGDQSRFNLAFADWSAVNLTTLASGTDVAFPGNATAIKWLNAMKKEDGTTSVANQVAANLIDYCDSNPTPTTDYPGTTPPTFVGIEKVPFINEVLVTVTTSDAAPQSGNGNDFDQIDVQVEAELVNYFTEDINLNNMTVSVEIDYVDETDFSMTNDSSSATIGAVTLDTYSPAGTVIWNFTYTRPSATGQEVNNATFGIEDVKIYLKDSSTNLLDYAHLPVPGTNSVNFNPGLGRSRVLACAQIGDARSNGNSANWQWIDDEIKIGNPTLTIASDIGSVNLQHSLANPSTVGAGYDAETAADPAAGSLSTAYIRNGPMQSLWELGAIHRGEPWRTINLHDYAASPDGKYGNGDWKILDQVKLGSATEVRGKVNANSPVANVWKALLTGVTVGGTYSNPSGGTPLDPTWSMNNAIYDIVHDTTDGILYTNGAMLGAAWTSRGAILGSAKLTNGTEATQADDRSQEEIIGKLANLLTVRQNYFTVIVVAQAVKDVGSATPSGYVSAGSTNVMVLGEQKILAVVYRDAFTNQYRIERYEYLE